MISIADSAKDKIQSMLEAEGKSESSLRVRITGRAASGFQHALSLVEPGFEKPNDEIFNVDGIKVLVDPKTLENIEGSEITFVDDLYGGGFQVKNPNTPAWSSETEQKVQEIIDTQVNPSLAMHGGHLELLEVKEDIAYVHFGGGCQGCGMVTVTLKEGVENMIIENVSEINEVIDTTDHASGTNPYYKPTPTPA